MSIIDVVAGAAFGSEGKGHITAQLVKRRLRQEQRTVVNVRVAGPNAGHTVIDDRNQAFALRCVPVGAAIAAEVWLYIAPGSEVELEVLAKEVHELREAGHAVGRLYVSGEATLLEDHHKQEETDAALTQRIGSTGKGIGAARVDRLMRSAKRICDDPAAVDFIEALGATVVDEAEANWLVSWAETRNAAIIIEGTQGYGLGLHAGMYPTTTSSDCRGIDFLAMAGIMPWHRGVTETNIVLVARVFPIRVAGNSGPLKNERTWDELGLPEERTTVTQKIRRVGEWDGELVARAVKANGGGQRGMSMVNVGIALTMVDQKFPFMKDRTSIRLMLKEAEQSELNAMTNFLKQVEFESGAEVMAMTTGPNHIIWR